MRQIIVIRKDLKMRRGKEISQGAHASLKATLANMDHPMVKEWLSGAFTKIVVTCDSEREMIELQNTAIHRSIINAEIIDNGDTEFGGEPTLTALALGPMTDIEAKQLTGHLKLR